MLLYIYIYIAHEQLCIIYNCTPLPFRSLPNGGKINSAPTFVFPLPPALAPAPKPSAVEDDDGCGG